MNDAKKILDKTLEAYGTIDILFNNAGVLSITPIEKISIEEWNNVFNVNLTSILYLTVIKSKKFAS